jgi:hypothetical protein
LKVIREVWDRSEPMSTFDPDFEKRRQKDGATGTDAKSGERK